MNAYKVEILIIDFDNLGEDEIKSEIENVNYPNDCLWPYVMKIESRDIGVWDDNHPLNELSTMRAEYERLFNELGGNQTTKA